MTPAGFPHSDIPGSTLGCQLPRAYRRLPRPSSALDAKASTMRPYQLATQTTNTHNKHTHGGSAPVDPQRRGPVPAGRQQLMQNDQDTKRYTTLQTRTHTHEDHPAPTDPPAKTTTRGPRRVHCSRPLSNNQTTRSPTSPRTVTKTAGV